MSQKAILVDTDAFVAWIRPGDALREHVVKRFNHIQATKPPIFATNLVISEAATLFSARDSQAVAIQFLDFVSAIPVIYITEELHYETLALFRQQRKKGTSMADCANVVAMKRYKLDKIFSFDNFYGEIGLEYVE